MSPKTTVHQSPLKDLIMLMHKADPRNRSYLTDCEEINGGFVSFGGNSKRGKINGKDFKLTDESHVLLKVPRKDNMYSVDLKNIVPQGGIENLIDLRVKVIRCENRTEFKNKVMNQFCEMKGIKREFSVVRTPQQNRVVERKSRTLIEAARTMLANSKLPITFWAEAINTACYVQNRVLVIKPQNKTPYELFLDPLFSSSVKDSSGASYKPLGEEEKKDVEDPRNEDRALQLPTKVFENDNTCGACKKGKQHRASCKTKPVSFVDQPLYRLHMDLFGPTFVKRLNKKSYCLVVTDDYSRFTWVFFLATKDETSPILRTFITGLENQLSLKVKVIRSENGTKFKNHDLNKFCGMKGIKREFSVPRTPQQNGIAERKNRTLIEAARTMLADSLLPIPFWAEAVNTACYVQN
nr:putative ribonuclease H-like domain-containing protein [Tanacetum cinerariifolium]